MWPSPAIAGSNAGDGNKKLQRFVTLALMARGRRLSWPNAMAAVVFWRFVKRSIAFQMGWEQERRNVW